MNCLNLIHRQGAVLALSILLCLLPGIFYITNRLYSGKERQAYVQGKTFMVALFSVWRGLSNFYEIKLVLMMLYYEMNIYINVTLLLILYM